MSGAGSRDAAERRLGRALGRDFWDMVAFAQQESPAAPWDVFAGVGLRLCGAFDAAFFGEHDAAGVCWHTHMRFSHDPPEAFTCMVDTRSPGRHWW